MKSLTAEETINMVAGVFPRLPEDRNLLILVDLPQSADDDNNDWRSRRLMAAEWTSYLRSGREKLGLQKVELAAYPEVGANNADLPAEVFIIREDLPPLAGFLAEKGEKVVLADLLADTQLIIAPTELSATAPLKNFARKFPFRAATMPGFNPDMIPALALDYGEVSRRVELLKAKLDAADTAEIEFLVDGTEKHYLQVDLRFRKAHMSSGRFLPPGTAGNLPSGEAYIVPYEGEGETASLTKGVMPVQIGEEMVFFDIDKNRAGQVRGGGEEWRRQSEYLVAEPAYGNLAELGFGVLGDFGIKPTGRILLDEKLGFHIALGRSDHFGGVVGPSSFNDPKRVIHLDWIYIADIQPRIEIVAIILKNTEVSEIIMSNGRFMVF